jgi:hypothetical protein
VSALERWIGTELGAGGRYRVESVVRQSGGSILFRAHDQRAGRTVAVHLLSQAVAADSAARERLRAEVQAQATLVHPHIVRVVDLIEEGNVVALVTDFIGAADLASVLAARGRPYTTEEAAALLTPVAQAIGTAHAAGVVHRDLTPARILVATEGGEVVPRVVEFGVAWCANKAVAAATGHRGVIGTPAYLPPEALTADAQPGPRADIYALGVILYELTTGQLPFAATADMDVAHEVLSGVDWTPSAVVPELGPELDAVVLAATARDATRRLPNAAVFEEQLRALGGGEHQAPGLPAAPTLTPAPAEVSEPEAAPPPPPAHRWAPVAVAVGLGVMGGLGLWSALSSDAPEPVVDASAAVELPDAAPITEAPDSPRACTVDAECRRLAQCEAGRCMPRYLVAEARAVERYRGLLAAHNKGDADAYFGGFAPELACLLDQRNVPRADLVSQRRAQLGRKTLHLDRVEPTRRTPTEVAFVAHGRQVGPRGERRYARGVRMTRTDAGVWRVIGETWPGAPFARCLALH